MKSFFHWLGTPFRAMWKEFPLENDGRQTLIYLVFAGAGPALTLIVMWAMGEALERPQLWKTFSGLAYILGICLLVITTGLGMFVSIRAVKISREGFEANGGAPEAARAVANAADDKAESIERESV